MSRRLDVTSGDAMEFRKRHTDKVERVIDIFFAIGVLLIVCGLFVHPEPWPPVLPETCIDAGAGMVLASIIAFFLE